MCTLAHVIGLQLYNSEASKRLSWVEVTFDDQQQIINLKTPIFKVT